MELGYSQCLAPSSGQVRPLLCPSPAEIQPIFAVQGDPTRPQVRILTFTQQQLCAEAGLCSCDPWGAEPLLQPLLPSLLLCSALHSMPLQPQTVCRPAPLLPPRRLLSPSHQPLLTSPSPPAMASREHREEHYEKHTSSGGATGAGTTPLTGATGTAAPMTQTGGVAHSECSGQR